jgi:hypothetical protein
MKLSRKLLGAMLLALLVVIAIGASAGAVSAYTPQKGDSFEYSQTIAVSNGQGSYSGYTDQSTITGTEQVNSVSGSNVSAFYNYSYGYSNSQGSTTTSSSSGSYTWSASSFVYLNGTDDEVGYSKPTYVWFAMDPTLPVGGKFYSLNTQFTVISKNYSLQLPTEGDKYVQTIKAEGTGEYQRNDAYGVFSASYTWYGYYDPSTGYVVGYNYIEQDNGQYQGQPGSFTYTDTLNVTSTSYPLALASAPPASPGGGLSGSAPYTDYLIVVVLALIVIGMAGYAIARRRRRGSLPKHSYTPQTSPTPPTAPWESRVDLGSRPSEQVVIREVAKVNCKYCGTLIPTTAERCPYCGGPRQ